MKADEARRQAIEIAGRLYVGPAFAKRRLSEVSPAALEHWHKALPAQIVRAREAQQVAHEQQRRALLAAKAESRALRRRGPDSRPQIERPTRQVTGHRTANQALYLVRAMYAWASKPTTKLFDGVNPAAALTRFRETARRRFLQPDELQPFFEALAQEPN